jgi:hypothetical protein
MADEAEWHCPMCHGTIAKTALALMKRVGQDTSFANLWARLDKAERDRDRILAALQFALDAASRNGGQLKPHDITVLTRARRKVSAAHQPKDTGGHNAD